MIGFFKTILKLAFIGGVVFLFFTACSAHKRCGDNTRGTKYHGKRYLAALKERDSLCNVAKSREQDIASLQSQLQSTQGELAGVKSQFEQFQQKSGSELNKLNTDLGDKDAMLRQREQRL